MTFTLQELMASKCLNIWHDMINAGRLNGAQLIVPDADAKRILDKCPEPDRICGTSDEASHVLAPAQHSAREIPAATSPDQWPAIIQWISGRRQLGEIGVGDTASRLLKRLAADRAASLWERFTGKQCRCRNRQTWLNTRYPYATLPRSIRT